MLIEKLKQIATDRGLIEQVGDEHWHNLLDVVDDVDKAFIEKKVYMLIFNDKESIRFGDFGSVLEDNYSGVFLLAVRSRVSDPSFGFKYDNHIKPLKVLARDIRDNDFLTCDDMTLRTYSIEGWRENYLDTNLDCVEVKLTLEYNG